MRTGGSPILGHPHLEQCRWPMSLFPLSVLLHIHWEVAGMNSFARLWKRNPSSTRAKAGWSQCVNDMEWRLCFSIYRFAICIYVYIYIHWCVSMTFNRHSSFQDFSICLDQAMASVATTTWDTRTALSSWATSPGRCHSCSTLHVSLRGLHVSLKKNQKEIQLGD